MTDESFSTDVMERSRTIPVVVDLWATWCGPCTTLGPMLEAAVAARAGSVELVKVEVDANPQISQMFQVQSIPAVFAVVNTQVVDSFVGAVSEKEIEEFLDRIAPKPSEVDGFLLLGDEPSLLKALSLEPANERAVVALATLYVETNRPEEALELLAKIPETQETRTLIAEARLAAQAIDVKNQKVVPLLDSLLEKVQGDDEARQEYVDLLATLGPTNPIAVEYRKKLAARLF